MLLQNKRWQSWALVVAWTMLIYSTLYIVRPVCEFLKAYTPFDVIVWIIFALLLGVLIYFFLLRWPRQGLWYYVLLLGTVLVYIGMLWILKIPEERIHLIQYGVLVCLIVRALRFDFPIKLAFGGAFVLTSLLGLGDEIIQHFLPNRYFQWQDVLLNTVSAALGLLWCYLAGYQTIQVKRVVD